VCDGHGAECIFEFILNIYTHFGTFGHDDDQVDARCVYQVPFHAAGTDVSVPVCERATYYDTKSAAATAAAAALAAYKEHACIGSGQQCFT